jgi:hypothetical protein
MNWSKTWLLEFHPDKCVTVNYGKPQNHDSSIKMNGLTLKEVKETKDLGVTFESSLSFNLHISTICNKANRVMGMIRRTFTYLDKETFSLLFKGMVRPHLEYAVSVWSPHMKYQVIQIEQVQRRATKLIPGLKDLSYKERLTQLKLPCLAYRRMRGDLINTYKYLHSLYDCVQPKFQLRETATRGNSLKLYKPGCKSTIRSKFFANRVINLWNTLPDDTVNAKSVNSFKAQVDKKFADIMYDFDACMIINTAS